MMQMEFQVGGSAGVFMRDPMAGRQVYSTAIQTVGCAEKCGTITSAINWPAARRTFIVQDITFGGAILQVTLKI